MDEKTRINKAREILGDKKTKFKQIVKDYYLFGSLKIMTTKEYTEYKEG